MILTRQDFFILSKTTGRNLRKFSQSNRNRCIRWLYKNCIVLCNRKQMVSICNLKMFQSVLLIVQLWATNVTCPLLRKILSHLNILKANLYKKYPKYLKDFTKLWKHLLQLLRRYVRGPIKVIQVFFFYWCSLSRIKSEAVNNLSLISGSLYRGSGEASVSRSTRWHLPEKVGTSVWLVIKPWLTKIHIEMCLK